MCINQNMHLVFSIGACFRTIADFHLAAANATIAVGFMAGAVGSTKLLCRVNACIFTSK